MRECLERVILTAIENRDPRDAKLSLEPLAISSRELRRSRSAGVSLPDLRAIFPRL